LPHKVLKAGNDGVIEFAHNVKDDQLYFGFADIKCNDCKKINSVNLSVKI